MNSGLIGNGIKNILDDKSIKFNSFRGKNILISGGAGFLGSWLVEVLISANADVTCVDNLATGKISNLGNVSEKSNFHFQDISISDFKTNEKYDLIFHLASRASPDEYQLHPIETLESNSIGTKILLELAQKNNAKLLFASTSEIYGDAEIIPTPENYWGKVNPNGIRSCYDEGKRYGEALLAAYVRQKNVDARAVRIFNTFGPKIRFDGIYGRALPKFCVQALTNSSITVFGRGQQTRSFCYITDTIRGILKAITSQGTKGNFINIGNSEEITILQLAEMIKEKTNSSSKIIFRPLPEDDPKRRCPDIAKAKALLNWEPKVSLQEGLDNFIEWLINSKIVQRN